MSLAQKGYDVNLKRTLEHDLEIIRKMTSLEGTLSSEKLYSREHPLKRKLIHPIYLPDDEYVQRWQAAGYAGNPYPIGNDALRTMRGEIVRSKSELLIANALYAKGIPYRYEYPLPLSIYENVYPDFYCLNVRTRKEYAWEHFGMMDDEEYRVNNMNKIIKYQLSSVECGMLYTFEAKDKPLETDVIDKMIEKFLV